MNYKDISMTVNENKTYRFESRINDKHPEPVNLDDPIIYQFLTAEIVCP